MDDYIGNKHFITVDDRGRITDGWSDGPHPEKDATGAICINEEGGYQFRLRPGGEENPSLWGMDGIPLYKYEDGEVLERTLEEIEADRAALPKPEDKPSPEERIQTLENENKLLKAQVQAQSDRADFVEDCIAEMAMQVYQ